MRTPCKDGVVRPPLQHFHLQPFKSTALPLAVKDLHVYVKKSHQRVGPVLWPAGSTFCGPREPLGMAKRLQFSLAEEQTRIDSSLRRYRRSQCLVIAKVLPSRVEKSYFRGAISSWRVLLPVRVMSKDACVASPYYPRLNQILSGTAGTTSWAPVAASLWRQASGR
jgi:hypothetical protein